jgi:aerobic-type carbon monoxide dehydrogenase small subunit (CoxS/CutS family)
MYCDGHSPVLSETELDPTTRKEGEEIREELKKEECRCDEIGEKHLIQGNNPHFKSCPQYKLHLS